MSTIELELFNALRKANVAEEDARKVADAINRSIDSRYSVHAAQLATRGDIQTEVAGFKTDLAETESRIVKAMADMQRWTIGVSFGSVAVLVALLKIWP